MTFKLEILPNTTQNFTPKQVSHLLGRACRFYFTQNHPIPDDFALAQTEDWAMIELDGKNYWLFKAEFDDFEPAIVYIENYKSYGKALDFKVIAKAWEMNGFSLHLSAQDRLEDLTSRPFKDLSVAILKAVEDTVFLDDFIPDFKKYGLYDIESWEAF